REGRTVHDNLMKVIAWTLPTSGGEALIILAAIGLGLALPITPLQILWVNMVTAVALGLTLAFEPTEPDAMRRPPRPADQAILSGMLLWRIAYVSALFVAGGFGVWFWALSHGLEIEVARTMVVNTLVAMEIFYLFSVQGGHDRPLGLRGAFSSAPVWIGVAVVLAAQAALSFTPLLRAAFDTRPLPLDAFALIVGVGAALLVLAEAEKWAARRLRLSPARAAPR
ncbi:MAG: carbonate dehydratase, partial [Alphaproteobacteria bacterium HGW-Alphaproteobacteria-8]